MKRVAEHLAAPLLLLVLLWVFHPFREVFAFDPDEGSNLIKARLVADGHPLYSEVWSDQPAVFTHLLRGWCAMTAWTVEQGRILVLLCSCVLLGALYRAVRVTAGVPGAIAACVLLVVSFGYLRLSVSVMLAVPSLMFAMLSICAALQHRSDGRAVWLAVSGVCLALSIFVKMWTIMLIPAVVLAARPRDWRGPIRWWAGGFVCAAVVLLLATVPLAELGQLVRPHIDVRQAGSFAANTRGFAMLVVGDLFLVILAIVGVVFVIRERSWTLLVPIVWVAVALVVLSGHEPLWRHHYLMLSVPLSWCGGIAVGRLATRKWLAQCRPWRGAATVRAWGLTLAATIAIGLLAWRVPAVYERDFAAWPSDADIRLRHLLTRMSELPHPTNRVVTDYQILAFRAGLDVPPQLAVTSLKRRWSGGLSDDAIIDVLASYRPDQIVLSGRRILLTEPLLDYLQPRYVQMYGDRSGWLVLIRNDLAPAGMALHDG